MNNRPIADIYTANSRIRQDLTKTLSSVSDKSAFVLAEDEKWTVAQIVEHMSLVEIGVLRICTKLLANAEKEGKRSDGTIRISEAFAEKLAAVAAVKLEAPEIVRPTGKKTIKESLATMSESRAGLDGLRPLFETFDSTDQKFPHPVFGDMSAGEWLALAGGHEARHHKQIKALLDTIGESPSSVA